MIFAESRQQREARLERQRTRFPELRSTDTKTVLAIDRLRRSEGRTPTSFGLAVEETYSRIPPPAPKPKEDKGLLNRLLGTVKGVGEFAGGVADVAGDAFGALRDFNQHGDDRPLDVIRGEVAERNRQKIAQQEAAAPGSRSLNPLTLLDSTYEGDNVLLRELARPANYVPAAPAFRGLSFAPKAAAPIRAGLEVLGAVAGTKVGEEVNERLPEGMNPIVRGALSAGAGILAGGAAGFGGARYVNAARAGKVLPVGMSIKDLSTEPPELQAAVPALRDALASEVRLRRSGTIAGEITAGRAGQAARISSNLEAAQAAGAGLDESLKAAQMGAKAGQLRKTFGQPLELTGIDKDALSTHLQTALEADGAFTQFNGLKALDSLIKGENVQPAQLKLLRRVFGEDIGKLAGDANIGRPSAVAELGTDAQRAIDRAGEIGEKQIAQYEQRALAQQAHADELMAQWGMDPTNARLKAVADDARAKGIAAANRADELTVRRIRAANERASTPPTPKQRMAATGAEAQRQVKAAERVDRLNPNDQMILDKAKSMLGEIPARSSTLNREALQSVEYWLQGNRGILDAIGETTHTRIADIAAKASGNLADSYLTSLFQRRTLIESALARTGVDEAIARKMAKLLTEVELKKRYPGGVPERLAAEIAKTTQQEFASPSAAVARGAAAFSQGWKNLAFGPADVGVFGQQALHATVAAPGQILAGTVNRALNALGSGLQTTLLDETALAKRLQYQLDGVPQGITTGIVQDARKGLLGHLGTERFNVGRFVDASSDFQFGTILGGLRNLIHEGNLVALHLTGQDITNPAVRATSAAMANSATSYAPKALRAGRQLAESATLMTPSMRRAQVTSILQMARVFSPKATAAERILGSTAIVSLAGSTLAVGKLLNDAIGVGDFEFDPSKKGFGQITSQLTDSKGSHIVLSLFPQQQVQSAIAKSIRTLAEGDPEAAGKEWLKLFMGSSSPALQAVSKAGGYGYQPGDGYKYGDLKGGLMNVAPLPPILQSYLQGDLALETAPFEVTGFNAYTESPSVAQREGRGGELKGAAVFDALPAQSWQQVSATAPETFKPILAKYGNISEWLDAATDEYEQQARERGADPTVARTLAESAAKRHPIYKAYLKTKDHYETEWVRANPDEAWEKWQATIAKDSFARTFDDWMPTNEQKSIIIQARGAGR